MKILILSVIVVLVLSISLLFIFEDSPESQSKHIYDSGFTYYDIEKIQTALAEHDIFVSTPSAITDHTVDQYCMFFDKGLPQTVDYCTTTAVLGVDGISLGNINIGGDIDSPIMAIANLETLTLESNQIEVIAVFETMIETLVCDCWVEKQPDGLESISAWLDAVQTFYYDSDKRNVKSKIDTLGTSQIFLEITSKDNSVLQTLIILK